MGSKTNEEKAKEIVQGVIHDRGCVDMVTDQAIYNGAMTMAEWKDSEDKSVGWHNLSNGDFPKTTGDYLTVCRNKNKEDGIFLYEVVYYTGDGWEERTNWEDIIAWREIPKYS